MVEKIEKWEELCALAAEEHDHERLLALTLKIIQLLEDDEKSVDLRRKCG